MKYDLARAMEFGMTKKPLKYRPAKVLSLVQYCIEKRVILDDFVLQDWFLDNIVKPRAKMVHGKYLGKNKFGYNDYQMISEYEKRRQQINEYGGLLPGYALGEAKQIFKYHLGNLVMNGHLLILPVINLTEEPTPKTKKSLNR